MADPVLLSICIPTFNRSGYLRVMLEALLPQVADVGSQVEVWVSDNASTDDTREVVDNARTLGPVKYSRNERNFGPLANIVIPATQLATGEYVWLVGDHNLFVPGALSEVVAKLKQHRDLNAIYVNFRCAVYPDDWPVSALGGYAGRYDYLANESRLDEAVDQWSDLVHGGRSALCTQVYAHIVRKTLWCEYWSDRQTDEPYTSARTTYPHTWMIARSEFSRRSLYLGNPALTIFNGAQSWSALDTRLKVYFRGLPELIDLYGTLGLPAKQMAEARHFATQMVYEIGMGIFTAEDYSGAYRATRLLNARGAGRHGYILVALCRAFIDAQASWLARAIARGGRLARSGHDYLLHRSRPARRLRSKTRL